MTDTPEVLTLDEVATYLRLPKEMVVRQVLQGQLPGRQIEDTWRFLKAAIDDWLRSHDSRMLLIQQAGTLAHDTTLPALRDAIYAARNRPEVAEPQGSRYRHLNPPLRRTPPGSCPHACR